MKYGLAQKHSHRFIYGFYMPHSYRIYTSRPEETNNKK
jgi:hypothetical protein